MPGVRMRELIDAYGVTRPSKLHPRGLNGSRTALSSGLAKSVRPRSFTARSSTVLSVGSAAPAGAAPIAMISAAAEMSDRIRIDSVPLASVGDRQFVGREQRDDLSALRGHDDFLLDARGGRAVAGRAVRLDREDHTRFELHRLLERVEPRDDRALVQAEAEPVTEVEPERRYLALEADVLRLRKTPGDAVRGDAGLDQLDGAIHPVASPLVGADLGRRRASHAERPVVAGPVADE